MSTIAKRRGQWRVQLFATLLFMVVLLQQAAYASDVLEYSPTSTNALAARADRTKTAIKTNYVCHWPDLIQNTKTTPMVLVIGLSIGGIAGIVIASWTFYQAGQNSRMGGGIPM